MAGAPGRPLRVGWRLSAEANDGSVETLRGQIRRPDLGIDRGRRNPDGFQADEPRFVMEVLSPRTRDFETFEKLGEYKSVECLDHIVFIEPDEALVVHWMRGADRGWQRRDSAGLATTLEISDLGIRLALGEIYDGVVFPRALRPRLVDGLSGR